VGVARQMTAAHAIKTHLGGASGELHIVGTAYSYLQEYLPYVAQAAVREGWTDFVGLGRMVLSYPDLPTDTLSQGCLNTRAICRTFSDCTTAPRNGLPSGCYPLDEAYKSRPEAKQLREIKRGATL
jgi:2,4-dienoyl-CoA reductase-like NADH-dependent reductase (Old Yellow Enzyme family)